MIYRNRIGHWCEYGGKQYWIFPMWNFARGGYMLHIRDSENMNTILKRFWKTSGWIVGDNSALHIEAKRLLEINRIK